MPDSKKPNPTHRKTLARALAAQTGEPYTVALRRVIDASDAGRLPARLDEAGRAAALRILTEPKPDPVYDPDTEGHRPVYDYSAEELAELLDTPPSETPPTRVSPDNPAILEMSPADYARRFGLGQPVQASDPRDQQVYDLSRTYELLSGKQGLVYISSPGGGADRYVFGGHHDVAGKGTVALGRAEALSHLTMMVNLARSEVEARMASIVATYGGGTVELDAPAPDPATLPCAECGRPGRYTVEGVTLCTEHRGLLAKFPAQSTPKVTLVDMDATWPAEVHAEYVDLLMRLNAARRA